MSSASIANMSCPNGGSFYACINRPNKFIGCCDKDPCINGCAAGLLHPASFDIRQYTILMDQQCEAGQFYTCTGASPPFWGCCKINPCNNGCPADQLSGAFLNSQPSGYSVFLGSNGALSIASSSTTSTASSSASTPSATTTSVAATHKSSSTPIIVGVVTGVVVFTVLVVVSVWLLRRRRSRKTAKINAERADVHGPRIFSPDPIETEQKAYVKHSPVVYSPDVSAMGRKHSEYGYHAYCDVLRAEAGQQPGFEASPSSAECRQHTRSWSGSTAYADSPSMVQYHELDGSSAWNMIQEMPTEPNR